MDDDVVDVIRRIADEVLHCLFLLSKTSSTNTQALCGKRTDEEVALHNKDITADKRDSVPRKHCHAADVVIFFKSQLVFF